VASYRGWMEDRKEKYEEIEPKAKEFYKTIGSVWCPPLNDHIVFNRQGFHHLIVSKNTPRPKSERKRRFALLPYAQDILKNPDTVIPQNPKDIRSLKVNFWIFSKKIDGVDIKIIVRQIGNGKKHFFSIYGKKQKSTP
jgi:hypothetical protein